MTCINIFLYSCNIIYCIELLFYYNLKLLRMKIINKITLLFAIIILSFSNLNAQIQASVVSIQLMPYNITPEALMAATINNMSGTELQVQTVSKLYNVNNELVVTVKSSPFTLKQGLNSHVIGDRKVASVDYSMSNQSEYIKTTHALPSGAYKICVELIQMKTFEILDEFCDEVESDFNQYLYLVFPSDKDTVETSSPFLVWSHSEPFNILTQGEYYRMVVSEIKGPQSAEEAIDINTPLMAKSYLTSHNLQYPYDAKELIEGGHYAWQVQKLANGIVTNKTEAWEFYMHKTPEEKIVKYVSLKKVLDGSYYFAGKNKIFFKFNEEYSSGKVECKIYNSKRELILPKTHNESFKTAPANYKENGYNRYEIDLNELDIKKGFYTLEVRNEKNDLFLLTFYVQ